MGKNTIHPRGGRRNGESERRRKKVKSGTATSSLVIDSSRSEHLSPSLSATSFPFPFSAQWRPGKKSGKGKWYVLVARIQIAGMEEEEEGKKHLEQTCRGHFFVFSCLSLSTRLLGSFPRWKMSSPKCSIDGSSSESSSGVNDSFECQMPLSALPRQQIRTSRGRFVSLLMMAGKKAEITIVTQSETKYCSKIYTLHYEHQTLRLSNHKGWNADMDAKWCTYTHPEFS